MRNQIILSCDDQGRFRGEYIPKSLGHTGEGKRHLAITVLLYNSKGQVLLQKRKHKIFNDVWDFTGATHPLHLPDGDETFEDATWRCLKREYNIKQKIPLKNLGTFNYFAQYGKFCENEHCAVLVGKFEGGFSLNPTVGYKIQWMDKKRFLEDIEKRPQKYTPWAVAGLKVLKSRGFFKRVKKRYQEVD